MGTRSNPGKDPFNPTDKNNKQANNLQQTAGQLGTALASGLLNSPGIATGFETANEVLASKGALPQAVKNQLRSGIDSQQQIAAQDLQQQIARSGLGGSSGALSVQGGLASAFAGKQVDLNTRLAFQEDTQKRSDLTGILGGLFLNPALSLAGSEQNRANQQDLANAAKPSGFAKFGSIAAGLGGAFLSGGGGGAIANKLFGGGQE